MAQNNNNNGLYFIVGALFAAVLVMGFFLITPDATDTNITEIVAQTEPASGNESSSEFNLDITEDGFRATTTTEEN